MKQQKRRGAPQVTAVPVFSPLAVEAVLERHGRTIAVALVLFASIRIIATYTVFSHTYDEPARIACGMDWLDKGVYQWEPQHPPLARVATALGPYLLGTRCQNTPRVDLASMTQEGLAILLIWAGYRFSFGKVPARQLTWVPLQVTDFEKEFGFPPIDMHMEPGSPAR